jgi:hypothetical protein
MMPVGNGTLLRVMRRRTEHRAINYPLSPLDSYSDAASDRERLSAILSGVDQ